MPRTEQAKTSHHIALIIVAAVLAVIAVLGVAPATASPAVELASAAPDDCDRARATSEILTSGGGDEEPAPVGTTLCRGVRPGAPVSINGEGPCTLNFAIEGVDKDDNVTRYIGTAAHCALSGYGEVVWAPGTGPRAEDGTGRYIGNVVFAVYDSRKDLALIRLNPGIGVNPAMCHFGGPTGFNTSQTSDWTELNYTGQGDVFRSYAPSRTAFAPGMQDADRIYAYGANTFGDSGAPVTSTDGRAVGVAVTIATGQNGTIGISRIVPPLQRAANRLGLTLYMLTASRAAVVQDAVRVADGEVDTLDDAIGIEVPALSGEIDLGDGSGEGSGEGLPQGDGDGEDGDDPDTDGESG